MTRTTIALLVGLMLAAPAVAQDEAGTTMTWYAEFDKAVEAAKAEGKDLLVDFTGSDWCGWCTRLKKEVFVHQEFLDGVKDTFVLVELDYPRGEEAKAKVPNPERNKELSQKFGIRGFPTILLMTADGVVYGKTGYQQGGPVKYVEHLNELRTTGKKALEDAKTLVMAFEGAADDAAKAEAIGQAAEALKVMKPGSPAGGMLTDVVKAGLAADPENASGLKLNCVEALMKSGNADAAVMNDAEKLDPKNEKGLLERTLVARFGMVTPRDMEALKGLLAKVDEFEKLGVVKDTDTGIQLFANTAHCYARFASDPAKAAHYAQKLVDMGALEKNPRMKPFIEQLLAGAPKKEPAEEKPTEEKPAEDKPVEDKPAEDKPAEK